MENNKAEKAFRVRLSACILLFWIASIFLSFSACNRKRSMPNCNFYENLLTGEVMSSADFKIFSKELTQAYLDSTGGKAQVHYHMSIRTSSDSVIAAFMYDVKIGKDYIVRGDDARAQKINMKVEPKTFTTLTGDVVTIGGTQDKPTMVNLWFTKCGGCIAEMPALNDLQKKYADKMNFIAVTFEGKKVVGKFLARKQFTFTHISSAEPFIKYIGTRPYPENIFIDKHGLVKYVEGGIPSDAGFASYFEEIIEELISQ